MLVDVGDDLFVDLASQNHFDDVHGARVGDSHALFEAGFNAHGLKNFSDLWPSAVNNYRVHADVLHQDNVAGEAYFKTLLNHGVTTVLDNDGFAVELPNPGEGFDQHIRFINQFLHHLPNSKLQDVP